MFEKIFDEYRKALDSSFAMQQEMFRQWMNGWPAKKGLEPARDGQESVEEQVRSYQKQWSETLAETLNKHREQLDAQYRSGIEAIETAFRTTEAKTPEEYWRLTQEFWRKSIDSFKMAFEAQTNYLQGLAEIWMEMLTKKRD
jgi:hypothetical protein